MKFLLILMVVPVPHRPVALARLADIITISSSIQRSPSPAFSIDVNGVLPIKILCAVSLTGGGTGIVPFSTIPSGPVNVLFCSVLLFRGGSSLSVGSRRPFHPSACSPPSQFRRGNPHWSGAFLPPGPRLPDSRGAGRREVPARWWCCCRAWGARFHGARLVCTAPPPRGSVPAPASTDRHVAAPPTAVSPASQSSAAGPICAATQARESPLERCASPPDSRGAGRREALPRRWCCYRARGTRAPEPGPGNPRCTCGCPIHGACLFRTATPRGGLSPGPSAHRATHSGSALGDLAGTPVLSPGPGRASRADPPSWFSLCLCHSGRVQLSQLGVHRRLPQRATESSRARGSTQGDF
ncbi:hypothetical protein NDU88_002623 [Pleurodeles waltl]|uniref:Uncharacterized protein n=1 Tax=Pleurodeles waltl TaxID=8319 RepID=A0AAV7Q6J4_PLEWA|nr:hypothetical protein NDU88_002623 [Pleurodeles waltl]